MKMICLHTDRSASAWRSSLLGKVACFVLCACFATAGYAQEPLVIPRLSGPVQLDGMSDEPAWQEVTPLPMVMHLPDFGSQPSERTEVRIAHDGEYLYIAGRLYDSDPAGIQGLSLERDVMNLNNDYFGIVLDTFNDRENALTFWTTPTGVRTDFAVSRDAVDRAFNVSWNTFWEVQVARNEEGWFAEFRIPFSSLRFQAVGDEVTMGLITWRSVARKNEFIIYPAIPPRWGPDSMFKPSQAARVTLQGVRSRKQLYVTPYALAGEGRSFSLDGTGTAYQRTDTPTKESGVDLKYGVTSNLTLDLTYNTDFAQVEADDQQVNLSRFSLFFPEKRLFFQERSSIFDFNTGGPNRLFYSRRIGLHQGRSVPIHGGARLVGRVGGWDVGGMSMQTEGTDGLASENFSVLRLRRQAFNPNSYVGGIFTSRMGADGARNLAFGLDGVIRLFGNDHLTLVWAQTFDEQLRQTGPGGIDAARMLLSWQRRSRDGLGYGLNYSRSGSSYVPGIGFEARHDYERLGGDVSYGWRRGEASPLLRDALSLGGSVFRSGSTGRLESAEISPAWSLETRSRHTLTFTAPVAHERLASGYRIAGDVEIPPGEYSFGSSRVSYSMPSGRALKTSLTAEAGTFFDGRRGSLGLSPSWNVSRHLEIGGGYQLDRLSFAARDQELNAHIARLRARVMFNPRVSASSFVQYNSALDAAFANVRLRYNPREGRDLFLVYNTGVSTDRHAYEPVRPFVNNQALLLKYSHTMGFGF